jgi:hypothetical protein
LDAKLQVKSGKAEFDASGSSAAKAGEYAVRKRRGFKTEL